MSITDWPEDERPRERLLKQGAEALSDAELLAIFLRVGIKGQSAVDLARTLIKHFGSLGKLFSASLDDFDSIPGMGKAKYAQLQAVLEMSKRSLKEQLKQHSILNSSDAVRDYLRLHLADLKHEAFFALWMDSQNRLIEAEELFRGTLTHTSIHPREIVRKALAHNAGTVVFAHNHPSGNKTPSENDICSTQQLKSALELIDVRLLDHFIVLKGHLPVSFAERGFL